jgi:predicted PolB exonuclease-like 3'-5' exonuclease
MKKLFLDIETLPADIGNPEVLQKMEHLYEREIKLCKQKGTEAPSFEDFVSQTSFDGGFGRILCIALAVNDDEVKCYCSDDRGKWDEKKVLENFWKIAVQCDLFVGHNVMEFDMRFIWQRSVILGVKPTWQEEEMRAPKYLSFAKYRSSPMYDTKQEWTKWSFSGRSHLEHIALAMGLPTPKDGIDGSQVATFYKKGEVEKICEYCKRDVETTRAVYKKMTFNS